MPTHTFSKPVDAPAERVWAVLQRFEDISWIPPASNVDVEGSGIGMRRLIRGDGSGDPIVEELSAVDFSRQEIAYRLVSGNPLPMSEQAIVATVTSAGPTSMVHWHVDFTPVGEPAAAVAVMDTVFSAMAGWLGAAALD